MTQIKTFFLACMLLISLLAIPAWATETTGPEKTITDGYGRSVTIPAEVKEVLCSGSGCLRYLTYLGGQDLIVGVDSIEKEPQTMDARGYALLNPQFKDYPLFGEFRGKDDPEKIIGIAPQLVFKTGLTGSGTTATTNAEEGNKLTEKTKIPVVMIPYGSLRDAKEQAEMFSALRIMGDVIGKKERADELITYIEEAISDLETRTKDIPESEQKTAYVGGVSYAGAHGIISTEPAYPPFIWTHVKNVAGKMGTQHADVAKEAIVDWDPEYLFMDVGTLQMDSEGGIGELKNDPALQGLSAIKNGNVYGVLPYNFYNTNYENVLADAYFIGKTVYPDKFADIDLEKKTDEIMTKFLGASPLKQINSQYKNMGFTQISL
ncbi:iron ABC transporter substrate-binding protein [Methanospirillum sp. J.3.6.1-F.2.7.3]|uniref:Iron ABC transporter substrate-binding protein n=1 Tax=Methanospirillum purgamenti TaxID=2834276 RepID=A0A8E7AZV5_9EURY|nr:MULTISPECIES: iron ABC transporter substrate-binding protein [Methanospirillum]MDX8550533.1 iron ABC transporter substrate-binding protein [Methanospirillum hungatei]QVV88269.1 iron ABC transporter substrate-binding protein [Methanospirillum sp. J.3.6.1-F.2.7.3]